MAAEAGPGGSAIPPQPQLGDKHNETSKRWYDAYSGSWVRKEIPVVRPNGKEKVVHNPAPWTPKEVLTRKTGLWKDNLEKEVKHAQDWGSLDKKFPVHEWLMGDMLDAELEQAECRKVEEARREAHNAGAPELTADAEKQAQKQAKKEFLAEKVEFYKTEGEERLSQDLQRYLDAEGCGRQKGGFRKGEQYGMKGAPLRADLEEQVRRWAEFFRGKSRTSASTGAPSSGQQDGGRKGKGKGKNAEEQQRARDEAIRRQQEEEQEPVAAAASAGKNGGGKGKGESSRATSTRARHLANAPELPPRPDRKEAGLANNDARVVDLEDRSLAELALLYHSEVKPCDVVQQWKDLSALTSEERGADANKSREIGRLVKQIEARKSREQPDLKAAYQRRYLEKWMKENRDVKTPLAKQREELRKLERGTRDSHDVERKTELQNFFDRNSNFGEKQVIDLNYDFAGHHVLEVEPSNKDDTTSTTYVELRVSEPEGADAESRVKHNQIIAAICAYHDWDFGFAQKRIPYRSESDPQQKFRLLCELENTLDQLHLGKRGPDETRIASHRLEGMDWLTHEFSYTERRKNCAFRYFNLQERAASRSVLWSVMKSMWQWGIPLPLREHCANSKFRFYVDLQVPTAATYNRNMVFESDFLRKDHPFLHALAKVVHDLYDPTEDGENHGDGSRLYQETKEQHWKAPVACMVLRGSGFDRWNKDRHVMRLRFLFPSIVCDKTTATKTRNYIVNLLTQWAAEEQEDISRLQRGEHPRNHVRSTVQEDKLDRHVKRGTTLVTDMEHAMRAAGKRDDKNSLCKCIVPDLLFAEKANSGYPETGSFVEMVWGESTSQAAHQRNKCLRGLSWGLEEEKNGVAMLLLRESDRDGDRKNITHIEFADFDAARTQFEVADDKKNPHKWYRNALSLSNAVLPSTLDELFENYAGPTRENEATNKFQEWCKPPAEEQQALLRQNTRLRTGGGS